MSQESYAGKWIVFRQPGNRVLRERAGEKFDYTYQANPGEVWEEDEFWINLSWAIDPDGSMGIRQYFESPYRPGEKLTVDDYYGWIFDNSVPGLPETAKKEGLTPLEYMRKYGAFEVTRDVYKQNEKQLSAADLADAKVEPNGRITKQGSVLVRWAAIEAAQCAGKYTRTGQRRERIAQRRGRNIGVTAAARDLLQLVYYALRDGHVRCLEPAAQSA